MITLLCSEDLIVAHLLLRLRVRLRVMPWRMCKRGIRFSLFTSAMTHGCYGEEV